MARSTATETVRLLGLGNDLLADDAFGIAVAESLKRRSERLDVVIANEAGFRLLDRALGVSRLVVVDAIRTGRAEPGTLRVLRERDIESVPGGSPHYVGLFDALRAGRRLGLDVPDDVTIVAVEAADCSTIGGSMHPDVRKAIPAAVDVVLEMMSDA